RQKHVVGSVILPIEVIGDFRLPIADLLLWRAVYFKNALLFAARMLNKLAIGNWQAAMILNEPASGYY
ncbi:MAG: hypothetical protein ACREBG_23125, partial [Pyrinomonadaceae bacterium]